VTEHLSSASSEPLTHRVKHELRRRALTVHAVERLTPKMVRVILSGDELDGFASASPDDHIKLFFGEEMRDFTPRRFDPVANLLAVDFVLHEGGPAGDFAASAKPGDTLHIGGPRGSLVVSERVRNWLLVGDETALPAIARRLEEFDAGVRAQVVIAVGDAGEEQPLQSRASFSTHWVHRRLEKGDDAEPILGVLRELVLAPETFVWAGAEAKVAKAVRQHLLVERSHPREWLKAAGYWIQGAVGQHQPLDD
jgi:NADPH-dependent ferric siderophore reductase